MYYVVLLHAAIFMREVIVVIKIRDVYRVVNVIHSPIIHSDNDNKNENRASYSSNKTIILSIDISYRLSWDHFSKYF